MHRGSKELRGHREFCFRDKHLHHVARWRDRLRRRQRFLKPCHQWVMLINDLQLIREH